MAGRIKPTINNFIAQNATYGSFTRLVSSTGASTNKSAATNTCGYINGMRFPNALTMPSSFGTGVGGVIPTQILMSSAGSTGGGTMVAGLEVLLGSIDLSSGTFTDGSIMPSRCLLGNTTAIQTAAMMVMLVVRSVLTATTPTITITYTNQAGAGSRSMALTLPTNAAINSAFSCMPHFQGTDTAVYDVSNITKSAGSSGILDLYGVIPMAAEANVGIQEGANEILSTPMPLISLQPSDQIGWYIFSDVVIPSNTSGLLVFNGVADA